MKLPILLPALLLAAPLAAQSSAAPRALPGEPASGVLEVRYGGPVPTLACDSLRVCRVELEAGERFRLEPALGDSERWLTVHDDAGPAPVVLVKPTTCGIATNLMLLTDRRAYDLDLVAGACRGARGEAAPAVRAVRFTYPGSPGGYAGAVEARDATLAERAARAEHTRYRWRVRGDFPWRPLRVADDGQHVYVEIPPAARLSPAPVLYALEGGERTLLNYATEGDLYVTDRVPRRSLLAVGDATLELERLDARGRRLGIGAREGAFLGAFLATVTTLLFVR